MFGKSITSTGAEALAAIDLAEPKRRLAEIAAESDRIAVAITSAERQRDEVQRQLSDRRRGAVDGARVAESLLAGETVTEDEPIESLQQRAAAFGAGIGELNARLRELELERNRVREGVMSQLSAAVQSTLQPLRDRAIAAVRELLAVIADAEAIRAATGSGAVMNLAIDLSTETQALAARLELRDRRQLIPSREIVALLAPAAEAIKFTKGRLPG